MTVSEEKLHEIISGLSPAMHIHKASKFAEDLRRADVIKIKLWDYGDYDVRQGEIARDGEEYFLDICPQDEEGKDLNSVNHTFSCGPDRDYHQYRPRCRNKRHQLRCDTTMDAEVFRSLYGK